MVSRGVNEWPHQVRTPSRLRPGSRRQSTSGGKIIGYGDTATGTSSNYDRQLSLDNAGHVIFGVYNNGH